MQIYPLRIIILTLGWCLAYGSIAMAAQDNFKILPGDILQITVWKEEGMDQEVLILPDGTFTFPLIGTLNAKGLSPQELENAIIDRLQSKIPQASVSVAVKSPAGHTVSIIGQVVTPGDIIIHTVTMTVINALSQAGGLTPFADQDNIIVVRTYDNGEREQFPIPYASIMKGKRLDQNIHLKPGDVIMIPTDGLF